MNEKTEMKETIILNKRFRESIPAEAILKRIDEMADQMNNDLSGRDVLFLGILNGAFMFASEIFKRLKIDARISFVKTASYTGTRSSGTLSRLIGLGEDIKGENVIILEDIVDSGHTLENIVHEIILRGAATIGIATLLFKPEAYVKNFTLDYTGFTIPNDFVVGFGLDYDGYGRNLTSVYTLVP